MTQKTFKRRSRRQSHRQRLGIATAEILISLALLMTVMSLVTTLSFRTKLIWTDFDHYRVASSELSNQLEELTLMNAGDARTAIESLEPSNFCSRALPSPKLSGEIVEDELGSRVVLRINWERSVPANPVELSGWIVSASDGSPELDQTDSATVGAVDDGEPDAKEQK